MNTRYQSRVRSTRPRITITSSAVHSEIVTMRSSSSRNQFGIVCVVSPTLCDTRYEAKANGNDATVASAPSATPNAPRCSHGARESAPQEIAQPSRVARSARATKTPESAPRAQPTKSQSW